MKIDVVIPWVDGNDPVLNAKRAEYGNARLFKLEDAAASTRFANIGEIFWCVASLNRFASWINRIYIVTDGQDPHLEPFLEQYFPQGYIPVEIIDHKVLFRGYEEYLPTFNSISIVTMLWRIPGLSEQFIVFNDDLILAAPVTPSDFFTEKGVLVIARWIYMPLMRVKQLFVSRKHGRKRFTYRWSMAQAAMLAGEKFRFFRLEHTPKGLYRSLCEKMYADNPELLIRNIRHRFRDVEQYTLVEYQWLKMFRQGTCERVSPKRFTFFIQPKNKPGYIRRKMEKVRRGNYKFLCFNSLDKASQEDLKSIKDWIGDLLQIDIS